MLNTLKIIFKNELRRQWEYKSNFISAIIVQIIFVLMLLTFILVIYSQVPDIKGWNIYDLIIYVLIVDSSYMLFSALGLWFDRDITHGTLNHFLVKPITEFVFYINFSIIDILFVLMNIIVLISCYFSFDYNSTAFSIIFAIIYFILTWPLLLLPIFIIRTLAFWFGEIWEIEQMFRMTISSFERIPIIVLQRIFFIVFIIITPIGYLNWYMSAAVLLNKVTYVYALEMLAIAIISEIVLYIIFIKLYKKGLKKYEGFGG